MCRARDPSATRPDHGAVHRARCPRDHRAMGHGEAPRVPARLRFRARIRVTQRTRARLVEGDRKSGDLLLGRLSRAVRVVAVGVIRLAGRPCHYIPLCPAMSRYIPPYPAMSRHIPLRIHAAISRYIPPKIGFWSVAPGRHGGGWLAPAAASVIRGCAGYRRPLPAGSAHPSPPSGIRSRGPG